MGTSGLELGAALGDAENARARVGLIVGAVIAAFSAAALQFSPLDTAMVRPAMALTISCAGVCSGIALRSYQSGEPIGQRALLLAGGLMTLTTLSGIAVVGPFTSPVAVLCTLIFAYGIGVWKVKGLVIYGVCATGHLALALAVTTGHLPSVDGFTGELRWYLLIGQQVLFGLTFFLARKTRSAHLSALTRVQSAERELVHQQALVQEVRVDLERAVDAARVGPLTGHRVGRYTLGRVIGRGATGEVYRAMDDQFRTEVAVKILTDAIAPDDTRIQRFLREARITTELSSPHIVQVFDAGQTEDDRHYLAMELLRGNDLATILRRRGRLPMGEVVQLVLEVAAALDCAHAAGVVHRDIKPHNLFLTEQDGRPRWKVLDFGASKLRGSMGTLTNGALVGTPSYMAPEQARGETVDGRTDVFALAAVAYRALTGRAPFVGDDVVGVLYRVINEQPVAPSAFTSVRDEVEGVLALGLTKAPDHRFRSARAFAMSFAEASRGSISEALSAIAESNLRKAPWQPLTTEVKPPAQDDAPTLTRTLSRVFHMSRPTTAS